MYILQNVVASFYTGAEINIDLLSKTDDRFKFNARMQPTLFYSMIEPKCSLLIYKSGKVIVNGCKTILESYLAATIFCRLIKAELQQFNICNLVASAKFDFEIKLKEFATDQKARFIQELFCGASYRIEHLHTTCLVYTSGNIVITGAKTLEQIKCAYTYMHNILSNYKVNEHCQLLP